MIINGVQITSQEQFSETISVMSDDAKTAMLLIFDQCMTCHMSRAEEQLRYYQSISSNILNSLYSLNSVSGITTEQSDAIFSELSDVIIRIREGALDTAIYRLEQKTPSELMPEEILTMWKNKIRSFMI